MMASDRRTHIIERSIQFFARHGFAVSTRDLAKHIGITQPLLYRYFESKEELISTVIQEVLFARWNPDWEKMLYDTDKSLEERLILYLDDYVEKIVQNEWIRLFIFASLHNPAPNRQYIDLLYQKVFFPLAREMRNAHHLSPEPTEIDIELIWGFHASFFYLGVRHWVYELPIPTDIMNVIRHRVRHFLNGYHAYLEQEQEQKTNATNPS